MLFTPPRCLSLGLHNLVAHHISKTAENSFKPAIIEPQERLSGKFHKSILNMKGVVDLTKDPSCGNTYRVKFAVLGARERRFDSIFDTSTAKNISRSV
jgi:hypothetical protein